MLDSIALAGTATDQPGGFHQGAHPYLDSAIEAPQRRLLVVSCTQMFCTNGKSSAASRVVCWDMSGPYLDKRVPYPGCFPII